MPDIGVNQMTIQLHTDAEDRWHAEIFYSLFKQKVTLAELQELAAMMRSPHGTVFKNQRYSEILDSFEHDQAAIGEFPDLAERCAIMPELLEGGDSSDPETAIRHLHVQCIMQELITEGYLKRTGHGTFMRTDKVPPKPMRSRLARK
jgi:hypothetical protein